MKIQLNSFFKALTAALFKNSKRITRREFNAAHKKLMSTPGMRALAQTAGTGKRLSQWQACVQQGYDRKRQLVAAGKGHNTLAGIPA